MTISKASHVYSEICSRLHRARLKAKRVRLVAGVSRWVAAAVAAGFVLTALEALFWFSTSVRTISISGFFLFLLISLGCWVGVPAAQFFRKNEPDDDTIALRVGEAFPEIQDRLADALQVYRDSLSRPIGASPELSVAALSSVHARLKGEDFSRTVSVEPLRKAWRRALLFGAPCLVLGFVFWGMFSGAAFRLIHPTQPFSRPSAFSLRVEPEHAKQPYGEDLRVRIHIAGEKTPDRVDLVIQPEHAERQTVSLSAPFVHTIPAVKKNLSLFAKAGSVRSETQTITVYQLPAVRNFQITLIPPRYTGQASRKLEPNLGTIEALRGTRAAVHLRASEPLRRAAIVFDSTRIQEMRISGFEAEGAFAIQRADHYALVITDTAGRQNPDPIRYPVALLEDAFPVARILSPAEDTDVEKGMLLPHVLFGEDDYGLSRAGLGYWLHNETASQDTVFLPLALESSHVPRIVLDWTWDMRDIGLFPEDRASYFFEVWDNDAATGPKRGRSRIYTVRFPSMMEIYDQVDAEQSRQVEAMEELSDQSQEMRETLSKLSDDLKAGKETGWETRKTLESQAERLQEMERTVEQLTQNLDEMIRQMDEHDLVQQETLEKYLELQQLYQEMASPEMQEALKKLQETLEQIPDAALKQEVDKLNLSQEAFQKSIERTLNLLKRLQVEQKVDELARRMEDMLSRQDSLNARANQGSTQPDSALAKEQERLGKDMADFEKEMAALKEKMQTLPNMPREEASQIQQKLDEMDLSGQMASLSSLMQQGQNRQAGQQGGKTGEQMASISQMLQAMQQSLKQGQKAKVAGQMRRASQQLLNLSASQENLMQETPGGRPDDSSAEKQASLKQGLDQVIQALYKLSQETFFVTPEMGRALGRAQAEMQQALSGMQEAGSPGATDHQRQAMGAMNQAVLALEQAMENMSGAQSGLGGEGFLAGLEQMGMEQMALNRKLMDLLNQGRLSLDEQASLSRMAAEQSALKRRLEEMLRQHGRRSEIVGRLDQLAQEMENVIRDLQKQQVDDQTVQRQQRILSRLLEAQHSLEKQDYSRRRQARSGEDVFRQSPADVAQQRNALEDRIRQDLLRLKEAGFAHDYEELIRKYFEALAREKESN